MNSDMGILEPLLNPLGVSFENSENQLPGTNVSSQHGTDVSGQQRTSVLSQQGTSVSSQQGTVVSGDQEACTSGQQEAGGSVEQETLVSSQQGIGDTDDHSLSCDPYEASDSNDKRDPQMTAILPEPGPSCKDTIDTGFATSLSTENWPAVDDEEPHSEQALSQDRILSRSASMFEPLPKMCQQYLDGTCQNETCPDLHDYNEWIKCCVTKMEKVFLFRMNVDQNGNDMDMSQRSSDSQETGARDEPVELGTQNGDMPINDKDKYDPKWSSFSEKLKRRFFENINKNSNIQASDLRNFTQLETGKEDVVSRNEGTVRDSNNPIRSPLLKNFTHDEIQIVCVKFKEWFEEVYISYKGLKENHHHPLQNEKLFFEFSVNYCSLNSKYRRAEERLFRTLKSKSIEIKDIIVWDYENDSNFFKNENNLSKIPDIERSLLLIITNSINEVSWSKVNDKLKGLRENGRVFILKAVGTLDNAADMGILIKLEDLHKELPTNVDFLFISDDTFFKKLKKANHFGKRILKNLSGQCTKYKNRGTGTIKDIEIYLDKNNRVCIYDTTSSCLDKAKEFIIETFTNDYNSSDDFLDNPITIECAIVAIVPATVRIVNIVHQVLGFVDIHIFSNKNLYFATFEQQMFLCKGKIRFHCHPPVKSA